MSFRDLTLVAIVGIGMGIGACRTETIAPPSPMSAQIEKHTAPYDEKQKLIEITESLRGYTYARYNEILFKDSSGREITRRTLEKVLTKYGLEHSMEDLERDQLPTELASYFGTLNLWLRKTDQGLELVELKKRELEQERLWGKDKKYINAIVGLDLISSLQVYELNSRNKEKNRSQGAVAVGELDLIIICREILRDNLTHFYNEAAKHKVTLEEELANPDFYDKLRGNLPVFYTRMGDHLNYLGVRDFMASSADLDDFLQKTVPLLERSIKFKKVQNLNDWFESTKDASKAFEKVKTVNMTIREVLTSLNYGHMQHLMMGHLFAAMVRDGSSDDDQLQAARNIIGGFTKYIREHREEFGEIDFDSAKDFDIWKQFPKLTSGKLQYLAAKTMEGIYNGTSAKEFVDYSMEKAGLPRTKKEEEEWLEKKREELLKKLDEKIKKQEEELRKKEQEKSKKRKEY